MLNFILIPMFKIEKNITPNKRPSQSSPLRIELDNTLKNMESGDSVLFPKSKLFMFYRVQKTLLNGDDFYTNVVDKDNVRIFKR